MPLSLIVHAILAAAAHRGQLRAVGGRIQVVGNSGSGKRTLGKRLAEVLEVPEVDFVGLGKRFGWPILYLSFGATKCKIRL